MGLRQEIGLRIVVAIAISASIVVSAFFVYQALSMKANQGYVTDKSGAEWKLSRMQTFGTAGEWIAVYRSDRDPKSR